MSYRDIYGRTLVDETHINLAFAYMMNGERIYFSFVVNRLPHNPRYMLDFSTMPAGTQVSFFVEFIRYLFKLNRNNFNLDQNYNNVYVVDSSMECKPRV